MFLVLVIVTLLCSCAWGSKYICAECGDDFESELLKYNTHDLCRDCYNQQPYSTKYNALLIVFTRLKKSCRVWFCLNYVLNLPRNMVSLEAESSKYELTGEGCTEYIYQHEICVHGWYGISLCITVG